MSLDLKSSVQYIKGVGPKLASYFNKKGIFTIEQLLYFFPRAYKDLRAVTKPSELVHGAYVTLFGELRQKKRLRFGKKTIYEMIALTPVGGVSCKYFKLPFKGYFDSISLYQKLLVVLLTTEEDQSFIILIFSLFQSRKNIN